MRLAAWPVCHTLLGAGFSGHPVNSATRLSPRALQEGRWQEDCQECQAANRKTSAWLQARHHHLRRLPTCCVLCFSAQAASSKAEAAKRQSCDQLGGSCELRSPSTDPPLAPRLAGPERPMLPAQNQGLPALITIPATGNANTRPWQAASNQ